MKTVVLNATNESVHLWHDDEDVVLAEDGIYKNGVLDVNDITSAEATIVTDIMPPDDWYGKKYVLVDGQWELNPNDPILVVPAPADPAPAEEPAPADPAPAEEPPAEDPPAPPAEEPSE